MAVRPGTGGQGRELSGNLQLVIRYPYPDVGDKRLVALCPPVPGKGWDGSVRYRGMGGGEFSFRPKG